MKKFLLFFTKRSVRYFIFACLFYLLFLVVGFNVVNYFSPENSKSLESIIAVVGVIFTGIITFIYEKEKAQAAKIYEKKIEISDKFLETLNKIINDNQVDAHFSNKNIEKNDELKDLLFMLAVLRIYFKRDLIELIIYYCNSIFGDLYEFKFGEEKLKLLDYNRITKSLFAISIAFKVELDILVDEKGDFYDDNDESENWEKTKKSLNGKPKSSEINTLILTIEKLSLTKVITEDTSKPDSTEDVIKSDLTENAGKPRNWHVNVGEEPGVNPDKQYRCWEDMKNFGFWSAGGGKRYADGVKKLLKDDIIYAYISGKGYVARGIVDIEKPILIGEFFEQSEIKEKLKTVSIKSNSFKAHLFDKTFEGFYDENIGEYAVKVKWELTKDGKPFYDSDLKISPLTICLMNSENLKKLEIVFLDNA